MTRDNVKKLFCAALFAAALAGCGGAETPDSEGLEPPQVETDQRGLGFIMTCDTAEFIYNAVCDNYGNSSSQCTGAYDQLHCFCQNCSPAT